MTYVDGFVIPVPNAKKEDYRKMAAKGWPIFKKHGALRQAECWADDVPEGKVTSFSLATQKKDDESVVFAWIEWPSRSARDTGMKAAMEEFSSDPEMSVETMPFDGKRMIFGGFAPIIDERR